jgi:hypothetical protein
MRHLNRWLAIVAITFACAAALAQDKNEGQQEQKPEAAQKVSWQARAVPVYRVDFTVSEVENGKKTNSRHYEFFARDGDRTSLRMGSRVPVSTGNGFQYMDVGVNIDAKVWEREDHLLHIESTVDSSTLADRTPGVSGANPVVRQFRAIGNSAIQAGKPTVIITADQVDGPGHFEVEVTATKLK